MRRMRAPWPDLEILRFWNYPKLAMVLVVLPATVPCIVASRNRDPATVPILSDVNCEACI